MSEHQSYASSSMRSGGPSMSLVENNKNHSNVGVGNYKGVMLCNRPFAGSVAGPAQGGGSTEKSFTCGVVSEAIGINVSIAQREKRFAVRPKKETALTKHKKWLADLQKTKDRLEKEYEEDLQRKAEAQQKFAERERAMRLQARGLLSDDKKSSHEETDAKNESKPETNTNPQIPKKTAKMPKPAWALTETAAEEASEDKELEDADELIDFAKSLDFEKYIDDMEIQTMMDRVKKRINELERDTVVENSRIMESQERQIQRQLMEEKGGVENSTIYSEEKSNYDEAYAAAKNILSEEEEMKGIHSTKSIAAIVRQNKDKDSKSDGAEPKIINEPMIVRHEESEGMRLELKNNPSNLPYIHRNPAV